MSTFSTPRSMANTAGPQWCWSCSATGLLLVTAGGPTADKPTVTLEPPRDADWVSSELIFRVEDCRATYEFLRTRGARFLTEPADRGGEIRAFSVIPTAICWSSVN